MDILSSALIECFRLITSFDPYLIEVSRLTIVLSAASSAVSFIIGVPAGMIIAETDFKFKKIIIAVINAGMGLPPVVAGLVVAVLLGRAGLLGSADLLYSKTAIFISQLIIALPVACGLTIASCGDIPVSIKLQLKSFGASKIQTVYYLAKEIKRTLAVIYLAAFGSVISEVGAVIMVGGNILGETRVLTTAIVSEVRLGNYDIAFAFAFVLLLITFAVNYLISGLTPKKRKASLSE